MNTRSPSFTFCMLLLGATLACGDQAAEIRARTAARRGVVAALVQAGAVVETDDGFLKIKDAETVGDKAPVVAAENADRKLAYEAVAKATGLSAKDVGRRQAQRNLSVKP